MGGESVARLFAQKLSQAVDCGVSLRQEEPCSKTNDHDAYLNANILLESATANLKKGWGTNSNPALSPRRQGLKTRSRKNCF